MTSNGTNAHQWDAENRLIQINYPGSGNNSQFVFDGNNENVTIVEQTSGIITATRQFVWANGRRCEVRDASSSATSQYFPFGQTTSGSNYFYTNDTLTSIRELTDSSGSLQAQYSYNPYGNSVKLQGSLSTDFQFAGYYYHAPSNLNLTMFRGYTPKLGRWLSRDPLAESMPAHAYNYVLNNPVNFRDELGLDKGGLGGALSGLWGELVDGLIHNGPLTEVHHPDGRLDGLGHHLDALIVGHTHIIYLGGIFLIGRQTQFRFRIIRFRPQAIPTYR
jgi:RHS repeat-associated protein